MKFILKLIADLSFYFTIVAMTLAILGIFASQSIPFFIWAMPAVLYVIYAIVNYRIFAANVRYETVFLLYIKIFAVFVIFAIYMSAVAGISIWDDFVTLAVLFFFISSITLMRFSRHNDSVQKQLSYKLVSGGPVVVLIIVATVLSFLIASEFMRTIPAFLYNRIFAATIIFLFRILLFVFGPIIEIILEFFGLELSMSWVDNPRPPEVIWGEGEFVYIPPTMPNLIVTFSYAIAILIAIGVLWIIFKKLTHNPPPLKIEAGVVQKYVAIEETKQRTEKHKNKLRLHYQRFLSVCRKRNIPIEAHFTSETYNKLAAEKFGAEDELNRLREIYLPVRYGTESQKNASQEDIVFAKKFVGRLRRMRQQ